MSTTEIRGTTDDSTRMVLGQIRQVFDPHWIQGFETGRVTIQFQDEPDAEDELVRFARMYGMELVRKEDDVWTEYMFE